MSKAIWTFPQKAAFVDWMNRFNIQVDSYAYSYIDQKIQLITSIGVDLPAIENMLSKKFVYVIRLNVMSKGEIRVALFATNRLTTYSQLKRKK
jgi:hypothetical protein